MVFEEKIAPLCALAPWRETGFLIQAAVLAKALRRKDAKVAKGNPRHGAATVRLLKRRLIRHCAETREKAASPPTTVEGPSQETCLKAISTTLRMKERGEGVSRYVKIRKPQTRSIRRA